MHKKLTLIALLLPFICNCYYWTISRHDGIFVNYDKAQYERVGERTYDLFIAKPKAFNIIKAKNKDSALSLLKNPENWNKYKKFNWFVNVMKLKDDPPFLKIFGKRQ
jgi:hypothetical protein